MSWAATAERGSLLGMKILLGFYRLLGARSVRLLLYPIVAYFFLTGRAARVASRDFLRRARAADGDPSSVRARDVYRHLYSFAEAAADKMAAWAGGLPPEAVAAPGSDDMRALLASGRGALLVGSHLGNLEMCRALGHAAGARRVNAVVYTRHAARFSRLLAAASGDYAVNLIQVQDMGVDTAILLKDKIDNGEWVVIVGDRTPASDNGRVQRAEFLGGSAAFAEGPWILASLLECPVYLLFCLKRQRRYHITLEPFEERLRLPRRERGEALRRTIQRYADRLAWHARRSPLQWFNFYDFWRA